MVGIVWTECLTCELKSKERYTHGSSGKPQRNYQYWFAWVSIEKFYYSLWFIDKICRNIFVHMCNSMWKFIGMFGKVKDSKKTYQRQ